MAQSSKSAIQELLDRSGLEQVQTRIDVLELNLSPRIPGSSPVWQPGLDDNGILPYLMHPATPTLRVFFITSISYSHRSRNPRQLHVRKDTLERLCSRFKFSISFLEGTLEPSPWAKAGHGSFSRLDAQQKIVATEGFYQYNNGFGKNGPATVWFSYQMDTGSSTYFLVDCPEGAKIEMLRSATYQDTYIPLSCPFVIDFLIANECASSWKALVDGLRDHLLKWETSRGRGDRLQSIIYTPDAAEKLHGLSRTLRIIVADLEDLQERLDFFIATARKHESALSNSPSGSSIQMPSLYPAIENLEFLSSRCRALKRWAANYEERTQLMIQLFFSIASQMDNRNNLDIANLTSKIAIETKRDSSSMITIAAVTMIFLPGTFISAIFSMVFFSLGTNRAGQTTFDAAPQLWYYFAITIPLTILVFAVWQWWRRRREADRRNKNETAEFSQEK